MFSSGSWLMDDLSGLECYHESSAFCVAISGFPAADRSGPERISFNSRASELRKSSVFFSVE